MSRAVVHPWWDPLEELPVESTYSHVEAAACVPCASCGEHSYVTRADFALHPWKTWLCSRCVRMPGLVIEVVCKNGHTNTVLAARIRLMQNPRELHCPCGKGAASARARKILQ